MTLVAKGTDVSFTRSRKAGGGDVDCGTRALLHDDTGSAWPRCSVLLATFTRTDETVTLTKDAGYWLGEDYEARKGRLALPPRALSEWTEVSEVKMIWYTRSGIAHPGPFKHPFGVQKKHLVFRGELPVLYKHGKAMRLELQKGCIISYRGFVWP